ncbi:hypothetical protein RchiOBHm_Chr1g0330611 [Rosa chinensis]|uniref:Uncharacterized protein n=1 Tax=Rosa chinensis TaxID=74649 RepID=A0A2P6SBD0_ROSCH|nr:hypothetical protein RchiOBHm_Chr1g0330611 [Rosa chinensis]
MEQQHHHHQELKHSLASRKMTKHKLLLLYSYNWKNQCLEPAPTTPAFCAAFANQLQHFELLKLKQSTRAFCTATTGAITFLNKLQTELFPSFITKPASSFNILHAAATFTMLIAPTKAPSFFVQLTFM